MHYTIQNQDLVVTIATHGAEIQAIRYQNVDYLHDANPAFWNRSAPILFPNIGAILGGNCTIQGKSYPMKKHGFIRDREFTLQHLENSSITLTYIASETDLEIYPFIFQMDITYQIHGNVLKSYIVVKNLSNSTMPFHLGLHPAFKVPLFPYEKFEDYKLIFGEVGTYDCPSVNLSNGTIDFQQIARHFENLKELPLCYDDYANDALVFDYLTTHYIQLVNPDHTHGVAFEFNDFPMLGIWTPNHTKANFICIEPWIGCADPSQHDGQFESKKYQIRLQPQEMKLISYQIKFF